MGGEKPPDEQFSGNMNDASERSEPGAFLP